MLNSTLLWKGVARKKVHQHFKFFSVITFSSWKFLHREFFLFLVKFFIVSTFPILTIKWKILHLIPSTLMPLIVIKQFSVSYTWRQRGTEALCCNLFKIKLIMNLIMNFQNPIERICVPILAHYFVSFQHIENQPRITFKISIENRFNSINWLCARSRS